MYDLVSHTVMKDISSMVHDEKIFERNVLSSKRYRMSHRDLFLSCNLRRCFNSYNLINAQYLQEASGKSKQQAGAFYP